MKKHLLLQTLHNDKHEVFDGQTVSEISKILKPQMELTLKFGQAHRMETRC